MQDLRDKVSAFYLRIRGSYTWLWIVGAFVAAWTILNAMFGFDPGLGIYNSIMSTEASVVQTIMQIFLERLDKARQKSEELMQQLLVKILRIAERQEDQLTEIRAVAESQARQLAEVRVIAENQEKQMRYMRHLVEAILADTSELTEDEG